MKPQSQDRITDGLEFSDIATYLQTKYGLYVDITEDDVGLAGEVAALQNGVLLVNVRMRTNNCRVFIVSHVFGHIVQYCESGRYVDLISNISAATPPITLSPALRALQEEYETEAFAIGLGLLKSVYDLTEDEEIQFQAFMRTDIDHYLTYLTSGQARSDCEYQELYSINLEAGRSQAFRSTAFMPPPLRIDPRMARDIYIV
ncbi:MAG: hypothetical protein ACJ8ER_15780 [Allosphingosinicella sp.]